MEKASLRVMNAIKIAGIIPTNGPISGIKFARPAIIPINIVNVKFAPNKLSINSPAIDIAATLKADKNCPLRQLETDFSILQINFNPTSKYLLGIIFTRDLRNE